MEMVQEQRLQLKMTFLLGCNFNKLSSFSRSFDNSHSVYSDNDLVVSLAVKGNYCNR